MHLDTYALTMLISAVINLCVCGVVLLKKPNTGNSRVWCLFSLFLSVYLFGKFFAYISPTPDISLRYTWLFELGLLFIPPSFLYFIALYTKQDVKSAKTTYVVTLSYGISVLLFILDRTSLVSQRAVSYLNGYSIEAPFFQGLSFSMYIGTFIVGVALLIRAHPRATGIRRTQYLFIAVALTGGFLLSITDFLSVFRMPIPSLGPIAIVFLNSVVAYAIVKHQLLDIKIIIRKALIYTVMTLGLTFIYLSIVFMSGELVGTINQSQRLVVTIAFIFTVAVVFEPVRGFVQSVIDRLLFKDIYDKHTAMTEFSSNIVRMMDIDDLLDKTLQILSKTFKVSSAFIMLIDSDKKNYVLKNFIGWEREELMECYPGTDSFINSLSLQQVIRNRTSVEYSFDTEYSRRAMRRLGADVTIALQTKNQLIGFVCLKDKVPGNYDTSDIEAIRALTDQLSIAIENADFYHKGESHDEYSFNTDYFQKRLEAEFERAQRHNMPVSVLYISMEKPGLDRIAMQNMAGSIKSKVRSFDITGHLAKNRFGIILPGADQAEVQRLITRLKPDLKAIGRADYRVFERPN